MVEGAGVRGGGQGEEVCGHAGMGVEGGDVKERPTVRGMGEVEGHVRGGIEGSEAVDVVSSDEVEDALLSCQ